MEQEEDNNINIPGLPVVKEVDKEGFKKIQKFIIWIFCFINPIIAGGVLYYVLKNDHPQKAKQANRISITAFLIEVVLAILLVIMEPEESLTKTPQKTEYTENDSSKTIVTTCSKDENCCEKDEDCKYIWFTGECNTPEYVTKIMKENEEQGILVGEAPYRENVSCTCESSKCISHDLEKCAKIGERSKDNFDMTTGKTDPNIEVINCCPGLKNIANKQPEMGGLDKTNEYQKVCSYEEGIPYNLCSPCGNDTCDQQYEDYCNCPEDCK